jgi:hypothetical protein
MKKCILLFLFLSITPTIFAQDSTRIIFSQEIDTLVKQRFIDRYENVFMTKVPTRHMFKIGLSQYFQPIQFAISDDKIFNNSSLTLGYEYKFLPAFSIALSGHLPFYVTEVPTEYVFKNVVYDAQLRWFVNMNRRIRKGMSANNFSGNYVALNYTLPGALRVIRNEPTVGIKFGFQRRVLDWGFVDFALAFQQRSPWFRYGVGALWAFSTQASFGYAFGDWKRSDKRPLCDILLCDESIRAQWKVKLPELTFGYHLNRMRFGFAYERKIMSSPFSVNFQYDINLSKGWTYVKDFEGYGKYYAYETYASDRGKEISQFFIFQPRYYFLQSRNKRRGQGGNGLSGLYTGLNLEYNVYSGRHNTLLSSSGDKNLKSNTLYVGALAGFQQRLFRHGYLDFNTSYNFKSEKYSQDKSMGFRGNLGLGFAF